jgi:hypothetical protein
MLLFVVSALVAEKLRALRALTGKRSELVETRKRLLAQIKACQKQVVSHWGFVAKPASNV